MRKRYMARLVIRGAIFILCTIIWRYRPEELNILEGNRFFERLSILHLLWCIWMADMAYQLIPMKGHVPLGSQKLFGQRFKAAGENVQTAALKQYIGKATAGALKVLALWVLLTVCLGILHRKGILGDGELFMVSTAFYVCDLICVLIWCPFRVMMRTRCCTTCRIFNWDHLMMFAPMIFVKGFYSQSLVAVSAVIWAAWEISILRHPERFWEQSNVSLKCVNCEDKLCTQYCGKK